MAAGRSRSPGAAASAGFAILLALVEFTANPPRWLVAVLWVALAASILWFLWASWPTLVGWWRRKRRRVVEGSGTAIVAVPTIKATGTVHSPTIRVEPDWRTGASARGWLHELFPQLRGVLLWAYPRDGSAIEAGTFISVVRAPAPDAMRSEARITRDRASDDALRVTYPKDFQNAPLLPLDDGDYTVEWSVDRGVGREALAKITFTMSGGKLTDWREG
jgi:hypothetical protein